MHLNLFILCVVLSQVIIQTISTENINKDSSDLLTRKKRVLNIENGDEGLVSVAEFPFIVNILLQRSPICVGTLLSIRTVITSALCASNRTSLYKVLAGSVDLYRGASRNVIEKKVRLGNHPQAIDSDGIALFIINSPFITRHNGLVSLHVGPLLAGLQATVPGWGCYYNSSVRGTSYPKKLRSITVPIMSHRECVNIYRGYYEINDEDVCVYDPQKHCGHTDSGAPLLINGELAGVYLKRATNHRLRPAPEIFVVLQHEHYRQWITHNIVH